MEPGRRERTEDDAQDERRSPHADEDVAAGRSREDRNDQVRPDVQDPFVENGTACGAGNLGKRFEPFDDEKSGERAPEEVVPRLEVDDEASGGWKLPAVYPGWFGGSAWESNPPIPAKPGRQRI